ncbi:peptidase S8/S53 domain-containing protein [Syncephalis plumigaleata]|nr:peptidase S8/S53 domain-containing protein [Syncephalis plumigaleata]
MSFPLPTLLLLLVSSLLLVLIGTWPVGALVTSNVGSHLIVLKGTPGVQTLRAISNHTAVSSSEFRAQTVARPPRIISIGNLHVISSQLAKNAASKVANIDGVKSINVNHRVRAFARINSSDRSSDNSSSISSISSNATALLSDDGGGDDNGNSQKQHSVVAGLPSNDGIVDRNGTGVMVYVLDTGIDIYHADLGGRAVWGYNALDDGVDKDESGHGTFVAGLLGGKRVGYAKNVHFTAVKVLDSTGEGSVETVLRGLEYVHKSVTEGPNKLAIVNLSLGTPEDYLLNEAVAAGNGDDHGRAVDACQFSPGNAAQSITVGATNVHAHISSFSNYGKCVDILAPGEHVHSISNTSNTTLKSRSGTSFAAPVVTGALASILSSFGTVQNTEDIRQQLLNMAAKDVVTGNLRGSPNLYLQSQAQLAFGNDDSASSRGNALSSTRYIILCLSIVLWPLLLENIHVYYT